MSGQVPALKDAGAADAEEFTDEMKALLVKCKIPEVVQAFFKRFDCFEVCDVKFLGETEGDVVQSVKDNVDNNELNLGVIKNIRKLYSLCTSNSGTPSSSATGPVSADDEAPLPDGGT